MNESNYLTISSAKERINIDETNELNEWCIKFGVSPQELKIAVIEVGNRIINIENFIKNRVNIIF